MKPATGTTVRVWSPTVRCLHGGLIAAVAISAVGTVGFFALHQPAGWVALGVVAVRLVLGFVARGPARFASFVRGPGDVWRHAVAVWRGGEPGHLGHNPLGGWMVLALMACIAGLALTGWLYTTDLLFGDATVEAVHIGLAWALLGLVTAHVAGVLFTGSRHRENLVGAMIHGRKRTTAPEDIG